MIRPEIHEAWSRRRAAFATKDSVHSVTLADIKAEPALADFALVRQSRLSVVPVSDEEWALICRMGGYKG